jgi:ribosomal protein S27AE
MDKYLARSCPKCRSNLGIIIAERTEEDNVQAIRGQCSMCGYQIVWALIHS